MLHLATKLFFVCEIILASNAIPTCLDKTLLIVNIRKAEVSVSEEYHMSQTWVGLKLMQAAAVLL